MNYPRVYYRNIADVKEEEYALIRKNSIGASDVASMFGVGFSTDKEVFVLKAIPYATPEELEIGKKPNVRKGKDLEPLILQKYVDYTKFICEKPRDMYEIVPGLTVNYDGTRIDKALAARIPVEIKYVSMFGNKYWTRDLDNKVIECPKTPYSGNTTVAEHLEKAAKACGIPVYYYTQIQTQMLGTKAPYGDLCALFDKDWEIQIYRIPADIYFWGVTLVKAPEWRVNLEMAKGNHIEYIPANTLPSDFEY